MAHQQVFGAVLVVDRELVHQRGAGFVETRDLDLGGFATEFEDHLVQRADGRDVPEMRAADVDVDLVDHLLEVEAGDESVCRGEKHLPGHGVSAAAAFGIGPRAHTQDAADLVGEKETRQQHAGQHAQRQIVGGDDHGHGGQHDHARTLGMLAQIADRAPVEGADGHHDHHCDQRRHGNARHPIAEEHHHDQQHDARRQCGQTPAAARLHVDDRLADHGAARHAAEKAGDDIGHALAHGFTALVAGGVGEVVDQRGGHHRFQQADHGHGQRHRKDDAQGLEIQRHIRHEKHGQAVRELTLVAHGGHMDAESRRHDGQHHDGHQRRRHHAGDSGQQIDDGQPGRHQRINSPGHADQLGQLRQKNENRQRVGKARDHRARDKAHEPVKARPADDHLQHARQQRGGQHVLQPVFFHQRHHHQRHGAGGGRDHAGAPSGEGDDRGHAEGGVQPHLGIDPGNDGKGNGFGDQRKRHHHAREQIVANVGQPVLSEGLHHQGHLCCRCAATAWPA